MADNRSELKRQLLKLRLKAKPQSEQDPDILSQEREFKPGPNPLENLSGEMPAALEAGLIAAGETTSKGLNKLKTQGLTLGPELQGIIAPAPDPTVTEGLREAFPVATAVGDTAPFFAIPGGGSVVSGAVSGAAGGALFGDDDADILFGGLGGSLGSLVGRAVARGASPFSSANALSKRNKDLAKKLGIFQSLDTAERTGNAALKNIRAGVRASPIVAERLAQNEATRKGIINDKILKGIGEKGKEITADVLVKARKRIGKEFEAVAKTVKSADKGRAFFSARLAEIEDDAALTLSSEGHERFLRNLERLRDVVSNRPTGAVLLRQRRELNNIAAQLRNSPNGDDVLGFRLQELSDAVDELLELNSSSAQAKRLKTARKQWANMSNLMERNVVVDEAVNPKALQNVLKRKRGEDYALGRQKDNPQFQLARLAEGLADPFGRPGTAEAAGGISATKLINDATVGAAASKILLPDSAIAKALISNQLVGEGGRRVGATIGSKAAASAGVNLEQIFPSLRQ